jgi:hypothetical protein
MPDRTVSEEPSEVDLRRPEDQRGVDIKRLRVLVMAMRPTTELLFRQLVGRIVRVQDPKADPRERATAFIAKFHGLRRIPTKLRLGCGMRTMKSSAGTVTKVTLDWVRSRIEGCEGRSEGDRPRAKR